MTAAYCPFVGLLSKLIPARPWRRATVTYQQLYSNKTTGAFQNNLTSNVITGA